MSRSKKNLLFLLALASFLLPAAADTVAINSPSFDFVRRVNYGSSTAFVADSTYFSSYAIGDSNGAQQTWFKTGNAVTSAAAGRQINSATLVFRNGTTDTAARTIYLARTSLGVTSAANRTTYDGTTAYPSTPGTTTSFSASGYLTNPLAIAIDATGSGSLDVTDWVKNDPSGTWFLTASPAPAGTSVTTAASASWGSKWHWQNALIVNGNTESPIQLVLDFSLPTNSPPVITTQPPARTAHYAGEPFSLNIAATGTAPLSYQWKKNGSDLPGATSATLNFSPLSLSDAADYQITVTNAFGSVTSRVCDLTVIAHPDLANFTVPSGETTRYHAQGNAVVGINQGRYFNRALYINNTNAFVLTGDKPMAKFASGSNQHGKFFVGITRGTTTKWLHQCANINAAFQPAHTTWLVTDPSLPGLSVKLEITALTGSVSFAARATATGAQSGDKLVWAYGGSTVPGGTLNTTYDAYRIGETPLLTESFSPTAAANNVAQIGSGALAGSFNVVPTSSSTSITFGRCSSGSYIRGNASSWTTPASLVASTAASQPLVCGEISLSTTPAATWSFTRLSALPTTLPAYSDPSTAFTNGLLRSADLSSRLLITCPDSRLAASAATAVAGVDGAWYGNKFVHGAMSWNGSYLGWRTTIGGTMLGWHDRVKTSADSYLATQKTTSSYTSGEAMGVNGSKDYLLTKPATTSRFYGKGYVVQDQTFYEMQTQYFDQILQDWRWRLADDPAHEAKLRAALELHLERARECYDPDDDGTYESVINTWPTDSIWFNGGGCPDETAYIYRGHQFARDLAIRAGDSAAVAVHEARLTKIKNALFNQLWVSTSGHPGLFQEQGGHRRLVNNPWLYSLCLPIEAAMLTPEQAATTLHYTEYGLQNDVMPFGGRRVWTSNFTPSIWSTRILWPGDSYMLAQSFFQSGFARDGWDVLRGTFLKSGFDDLVPGDSSVLVGGSDFGDCVHTLTRTIVEGLFGYQPDFPNGKARIAPQFPADWEIASMKTPDVTLNYSRSGNTTTLKTRVQRSTTLEVDIPVRASAVSSVTVNGASAAFTTHPGFGNTIVRVSTSATAGVTMEIVVTTGSDVAEVSPTSVQGITGTAVNLTVPDATLVSFSDPQGTLQNAAISGSAITGTLSENLGHHRVFATVTIGGLPQTRMFNVETLANPTAPVTTLSAVPGAASWSTVNMAPQLTADITTIYQQQYLSPRPATISSRVGTDGYTPWTFPHWGISKPTISINSVAGLLDPADNTRILTPQGVPFRWGGSATNVAFTSLWDNWPDLVTVPVNQSGEAAWFLICGSTTVMQTRISNAVLRLKYADNVEETLELIPPYNYWNLSPITGISNSSQFGGSYYNQDTETYSVPKPWPMTVQLGTNCNAMVLNRKLRPGVVLTSVALETLSQESVVGLMGVTVMNPANLSGPLEISGPASVSAGLGGSATFTVTANGAGPYNFQWFKSENPTALGTGASLTISPVTSNDYGSYYAVVTNGSETVTSQTVVLSTFSGVAWDGVSGPWGTAANWSASPDAATPNPTGIPTANDQVLFNINPAHQSTIVTLGANQAAAGMVFQNRGFTTLRNNDSALTLGSAGITVLPGAGAVNFNETPATYGTANVIINAAQTWSNQSSSPLTISGNSATAITVNQPLEIGGSGNTVIANLAYLAGNGGITKTGSGTLTVGNNAGTAGNTRFTIDSQRGGNFRMEAGTLVISPTQYLTLGESTGGSATASYTQTGGSASYTGNAGLYIGNWTSGADNVSTFSVSGGSFTQSSNITYVGRQTGSGSHTGNLSIGGGENPATFTSPAVSIGGAAANAINTGNVMISANGTLVTSLINKPGGTANLTFDGGTLQVLPGTTSGSTLLANVLNTAQIKHSGATIDTNAINVTIAQALSNFPSHHGPLTKSGLGTLTLSGPNSFTGGVSVRSGSLVLASTGKIVLRPTSNGSTSQITGPGTATIDGNLHLDLSAAALAHGNAWTLVNVATKSFGSTFSLTSTLSVPFTKSANLWTATEGTQTWTFNEATGILTLTIPTPFSTWIDTFTSIPTNQRNPIDDPDGDGSPNLLEFALHGDPASAADHGFQRVAMEDTDTNGLNELTIVIAVRNGAGSPSFTGSPALTATSDDVVYTVQGSFDLNFPSQAVVSETSFPIGLPALPTGWEYRRFRLVASESPENRGFLRVNVSEAE